MIRKWAGVGLALMAWGAADVSAQDDQIVAMDTLNVRDVLYHLGGGGGNGLALIDEINGGVVLIDTKMAGWGDAVREVIAQVTDLPVTTIINTHAHADHTGSNSEFPDVVEIVAHERTKEAMVRDAVDGADSPGLPTTTFTDRFSLLDDLDRIDLYHFGVGHTAGDIVVVFPQKGVAYLGDLFPDKRVPRVDLERGGSVLALPGTLDRIVAEIDGVTRVITGHGPLPTTYAGRGRRDRGTARAWSGFLTWDDLAEYADFTREYVTAVEEAFAAGQSVEEATATLTVAPRYGDYDLGDAGVAIERFYEELSAR